MISKVIVLILLCVLLFAPAACSQVPPDGPVAETAVARATASPSPKPQTAPTQTAAAGNPPVTATQGSSLDLTDEDLRGAIVHFWHPWAGQVGEAVQALVDSFNRENQWKIFVVAVYQGSLDDLSANVAAALGTRDQPDLAAAYLHQAQGWAPRGADEAVVNLSKYVDDAIWGFSPQEQADFYEVFWQPGLVDGKRIGLPALRSGQMLYYNVSWARELGFDAAPRAFDQFEAQACAAASAAQEDGDPHNDGAGGWIISTEYPAALSWFYAFGADIMVGSSGNYQFNSPEVEAAFTSLRRLYDDGCAWLDEGQTSQLAFAGRQSLFAAGSVMGIPYQAEANDQQRSKDLWTLIPFPGADGEAAFDVYGPSYIMLSSSPERQLASWVFVKWLLRPHNLAQLVEASSSFPLRVSALDHLDEYSQRNPQWRSAVEALALAHSEPNLSSWDVTRWAVQDAFTQLFRFYFSIDGIPGLAAFLDRTAADLQQDGGAVDGPGLVPWAATPETTNSPGN